ncbi:DUF1850 domain-containing protein [Seohaeicola saemankumensis]|uniref:DUF1850 domain-containing protein n=1 Tax=Seohaeicola saemankumensis TaxID=481181 RepID=A0ABW3TD63_9RHOB
MIRLLAGRFFGTALLACVATASLICAAPVLAQPLLVAESRQGLVIGQLRFDPGQEVCLSWSHSVTGGPVSDCFENKDGILMLTRSYLHDFAAGLGEVAGRGTLRSAEGGGYWIDGIDEPIPGNALPLRVGAPRVAHVLRGSGQRLNLSARAAGARVNLRLIP